MGDSVIIAPAFFFLVGYIVWTSVTTWERRQQVKLAVDFNTRLLERLGSVKEFADFLQTDVGARFIKSLTAEAPLRNSHERIQRAVLAGVVLLSLGVGLLMLARMLALRVDNIGFLAFGVIVVSLGTGFLLAALVSAKVASMLTSRSDLPSRL